VDDIRQATPRTVIADGRVVVENHKPIYELPALPDSALKVSWLARRVIPDDIGPEDFMVKIAGSNGLVTLPAIEIVDKTITRRCDLPLPLAEGRVGLPKDQDVLKVSVMNRNDDGFMTAFLSGFGAKVGGLASSISHEIHKPLVIGCRETDMVVALQHQKKMGGGVVLVDRGEILAEIPLPIGGLMSVASLNQVAAQMDSMKTILREMGSLLEDPVFTVGFLGFSALPWIRLTPSGLLDVKNLKIVYP
jgi:adenine deaminase